MALGKIIDVGGKLYTICLDRPTGKILWKREAPRPRLEPYQPTNSPASPSPVTDGKRVYVFFGDFGLLAYGFDGAESWRLPLGPFNKEHPVESEVSCRPAQLLMGFWLTESQTNASRYPLSKSRGGNWSALTVDGSTGTRDMIGKDS